MRVTFSAPAILGAMVMAVAVGGRAEAGPVTEPDLTVANIQLSDPTPAVGQIISVTVNISNQGTLDAAAPFDVDLFYDRASPPAVGERGDEWKAVASLAGKSSTTVVFTGITSLVEATWGMYAIVDTNDVVAEGDETDNVSVRKGVPWECPDLVVQNIVPSNASPTAGDTISVSVTVGNVGTRPADSFAVDLFYNRGSPPSLGETGDQTQTVSFLDVAGTTVVTFTGITSASPGTWYMYVIVNTDEAVVESDTTNNVGGPTQVIWGSAGTAADLTVTAIAPSSTTPSAGSTINVDVTVKNQGDAAVGSFRLDLFHNRATAPSLGDTGNQSQTVSGLAAGATTSPPITFTGVTSAVPADWSMYAIVDTLDGVGESDETNNIAGPTALQWQGVDLLITSITPSDTTPLMGGTISVDVAVMNQGSIAAGAFDVGLFYNEAAAPSPGGAANQTQNVGSLAAGSSTMLTFNGVTSTSSGQWSMYAIADNALSTSDLDESDETNNVTGPVSVTWRAPDLVVMSIAPSNSSPTAGTSISVDVMVENQGDADAGAFVVGLYFSELSAPDPGDPGTTGKATPENVTGLAAGQQTTVTFTNVSSASAVTWSMYAAADDKAPPGDDVTEADETNNVGGPVDVIWGAAGTSPDLVVISVSPSKLNPAIGEMISVDVTVENQGDAAAGGFDLALLYDQAAPPSVGDTADQTKNVTSLGVGAQTVETFTGITSATAETWNTYAVADNGSAVTESNETNNVSTAAAVTWHAPELVITLITPSNTDPDVGGTISVDVTVRNNGDAPAGAFDVGLFSDQTAAPSVGDAADETQNVASLAAGAETTLTFAGVASPSSGTWSMYAAVDNSSAVAESDEANNVSGPTVVTWHGPDLVIPAITPSDATPDAGGTISIDVTIRNLGDRDAGAFDVALFYNKGSAPSVGDAADQTKSVTSLAAGDLTTVTFTGITNAIDEVWRAWAIADNGSAITEGDETNNVTGPVQITWGAPAVPDLVVVSIIPTDAGPNTGDTISVDVTIANNGTSDASLFDVGLYYDLASTPGAGEVADQMKGVGTLAAGEQKTLMFSDITNNVSEVWQMYALADLGDVVVESNEANNTAGPVEVNWGAVVRITVLVPNGGEAWESGTVQQVTWESHGASWTEVTIEYTVSGGTDWTVVVSSTVDDGTYDWEVPLADSAECLVRVTSEGGSYSDQSDDLFTVVPPSTGKPDLKIVSISPSNAVPNVGDTITVDVTVRNTGNGASGLFYVDLFYSRSTEPSVGEAGDQSKPVSFLDIGTEAKLVFPNISSASAGVWNTYAVVDTHDYVEESNEGDNVAGPTEVGWSTMVDSFRITDPNGSELIERSQTYTVTWTWTGDPGSLVQIEASTSGGATWEVVDGTLNDGSYEWTVSGALSPSSHCRLRISNFSGSVTDVSDDVFTIVNAAPTASISAAPTSGTRPVSVSFDGSVASDPEGAIALYEWDFDYDGVPANFTADATGPAVAYTYKEAGSFTAALRVTDADEATDIATVDIDVGSLPYFGSGCTATGPPVSWKGFWGGPLPLFAFLASLGLLRWRAAARP